MGIGSTTLGATTVTTSPTTTLVATRMRAVVGATVATLEGVIRRPLLNCMHGNMRTIGYPFSHTRFFQSEHETGLIKGRKRITLVNQGGNTAISLWKTKY